MNYIILFDIPIPTYSIMIILGLTLSNVIALKIIRKHKLNSDNFILLETYCLSCGMFGAKLLYLFIIRNSIDWSQIFNWSYSKNLLQGGFVFYGGLIGGLAGIFIASYLHKIDAKTYITKLIFCVPLAHCFGRIGCYLSGCCYGMPYSGLFYVEYHNIPYTLCNVKLFPIQLVEAVILFLLAILYFYLVYYNKKSTSLMPITYFITYAIIRFILEFYRFDAQRGSFGAFSTSQWISLIILISSLLIITFRKSFKNFYTMQTKMPQ